MGDGRELQLQFVSEADVDEVVGRARVHERVQVLWGEDRLSLMVGLFEREGNGDVFLDGVFTYSVNFCTAKVVSLFVVAF